MPQDTPPNHKTHHLTLPTKPIEYMDIAELYELAQILRNRILEVVSTNGGHLSSSLGAVDIILAMHYVFNRKYNPFIFDVSHQAYAHKLLSGRFEEFSSLRQFGGLSGFCNPKESNADYFIAGHSSTSISLGVGVAKAYKLEGKNGLPVVLIGDGSMSAGLTYEALNELGDRKYPMVIILNDNEMSIARPIGAISKHLSHLISHPMYQSFRNFTKKFLEKMPDSATYLAKRVEESFKLITPGILFEEMGISYIGPIDGHKLEEIIFCLKRAREMERPVIVHIQTIKGKGYKIAEGPYEKWHGVSAFDLETGLPLKKPTPINSLKAKSPTEVYSNALLEIAKQDKKVVGITAAMPGGVGLGKLMDLYPDRFWDAGIAEQHCVTSMAAMAKEGFIPFVSIYSTFLQRAFDQIIHDVGIMSLPVRFSIDRAGIVGEDGETHQGLFDIAYLRIIPNFVLFAPRDNANLIEAVKFAYSFEGAPCAYRYPRGNFVLDVLESSDIYPASPFALGKCEVLKQGKDIALIGYGNGVGRAYVVKKELESLGFSPTLVDLRFIKPLDKEIATIIEAHLVAFVFSDSYKQGGVASAINEVLSQEGILKPIISFELDSIFVPHGNIHKVEEHLGLDSHCLISRTLDYLRKQGIKPATTLQESKSS